MGEVIPKKILSAFIDVKMKAIYEQLESFKYISVRRYCVLMLCVTCGVTGLVLYSSSRQISEMTQQTTFMALNREISSALTPSNVSNWKIISGFLGLDHDKDMKEYGLCAALDDIINRKGDFKCRKCAMHNNVSDNSKYFLTVNQLGRLGNNMFEYAALKGVSMITGHNPILPDKYKNLRTIFPNISIPIGNNSMYDVQHCGENRFNISRSVHCMLSSCQGRHLFMVGYFAEHVWFDHIQDDIRADFTFSHQIQENVSRFFYTNIFNRHMPKDIVTVGIQFRLTDRTTAAHVQQNKSIMASSYFFNSMEYFTQRFPTKSVYFVLISDDQTWVSKNIVAYAGRYQNVIQSQRNSGPVDLAIMAACDHTVISVGTYSWWGAWLSKGTTVYFAGFPRPGYEAIRTPGDNHIPPPPHRYNHWVPIGE